jgi:hypothetical protein
MIAFIVTRCEVGGEFLGIPGSNLGTITRIPHGEKPARSCFGGDFLTFPAELRFPPGKRGKLGPDLETLKPGSFFEHGGAGRGVLLFFFSAAGGIQGGCC